MTSARTAAYGVGAALLVACLAAANMPSDDPPAPERQPRRLTASPEKLADEVSAQAARLQRRMAQAPVPESNPRNPFSFGLAPRAGMANGHAMRVPAVSVPDPGPAVETAPPLPELTLMGIAEETTAGGPRRTAVIGGDEGALYMVGEGEPVGARYKVTKIGADAVELEDVVSKAFRRLALR